MTAVEPPTAAASFDILFDVTKMQAHIQDKL